MVSGAPAGRSRLWSCDHRRGCAGWHGHGREAEQSGISIGQAVFATEHEPHLLAALLQPDRRGNDHGALTVIAFGGCHSEDPGRERVRLGGDGSPSENPAASACRWIVIATRSEITEMRGAKLFSARLRSAA